MFSNDLFGHVFLFFSRRRLILLVTTAAVIVISTLAFFQINVHEDIRSMLPDDTSEAALSFKLLQQAPFTRKVIINLNANTDISSTQLIEAADRLTAAMTSPYFMHVVAGPGERLGWNLFSWLIDAQPNLVTDQDINKIRQSLKAKHVRQHLSEVYARLLSPEGSVLKRLYQVDPLALRFIGLEKLRFLNMIPSMRLEKGHFISSDGKNALIIADTPLEITDYQGARKMLDHFQRLASDVVPQNISVSLVSGHRYTVANAEAIKRDVVIILICSSVAIFVIFLIFLRSWSGLCVYLVPLTVLCIAAGGMSMVYDTVSAMTIGFGAVLLGISVDFALHVYFALRAPGMNPQTAVGQVSRPIIFCALTTMGAFGVLLFSNLPMQRELAVFSIIGIGASFSLSLIVLPHAIRSTGLTTYGGKIQRRPARRPAPKFVVCCWLVVLALSGWQATRLQFDGDMRSLNLVPEEIRMAEKKLKQTWGNIRGKAIVFTEGATLQTALEFNDRIFQKLSRKIAPDQLVSLASILPSQTTQQSNRQRWQSFWSDERKARVQQLLATEGQFIGFKPTAFEPFIQRLSQPSPPLTAENMRTLGFGEILDALIMPSDDSIHVLTLVPDTPEVAALFDTSDPGGSGIRFVSQSQFAKIISNAITDEFIQFIIKASAVVCLLLGLLFRKLTMVLLALIPVVTGMLFMVGVMSGLGIAFNLFNIVAAILIIGLGVDYGIFMVSKISKGVDPGTERAVFVSGLTTIAGFGALVIAQHPALHSIGLTVLLGISAAIPSALLVIPALYRKR